MSDNNEHLNNRLPLLVGLLVDVSYSMSKEIADESGESTTRLQALRNAIDDLVIQARIYCESTEEDVTSAFHFFCIGFGFGNALSRALGKEVQGVRNLLDINSTGEFLVDAKKYWITGRFFVSILVS